METLKGRFNELQSQRSLKEKLLSKLRISSENIAFSVFPIVEAIHDIEPDYILALDRGGRLVGLATYMLHRELYGRLPTSDGSIHFEKISRRLPAKVVYERLKCVAGKVLKTSDSPNVFVIDDWINTGKTKRMITQNLSELSDGRITVYYGMLRGWGRDVIADRFSLTVSVWHNNGTLIGVEYPKGSSRPRTLRSPKAVLLRRQIAQNIKDFATVLVGTKVPST